MEFVGSAIRELAFLPGTARLAVVPLERELVLLDAEGDGAAGRFRLGPARSAACRVDDFGIARFRHVV